MFLVLQRFAQNIKPGNPYKTNEISTNVNYNENIILKDPRGGKTAGNGRS